MCGGWVRAAGSAPSVSSSRLRSAASRSAPDDEDSSSAMDARSAAAAMASPMVRMRPGIAMTSRRRIRAPSSRASRRARPTCDWAARAAYRAIAGSIAVAADEQVGHRLDRRSPQPHVPRTGAEGDDDVLERGRAEDPDGARGRLLEGLEQRVGRRRSVSRSASSTMMTRHRPTDGRSAASWTRARVSSTRIDRPSVAMTVTSAWVPSIAVRHSRQIPQPSSGHCSAAANARAADRPARARRAGEQPGVGHRGRVGHRSGERGDGVRLADDVVPDAHDAHLQCECRRRAAGASPSVDLVRREGGVDDEVAVGVGLGEGEEVLPDRLVEVVALGLEPVVHVAAAAPAGPGADVEDDGEVGTSPATAHAGCRRPPRDPRSRPAPW